MLVNKFYVSVFIQGCQVLENGMRDKHGYTYMKKE